MGWYRGPQTFYSMGTDVLNFAFTPIGATISDVGNVIVDSISTAIKSLGTIHFMDIGAKPEPKTTMSKPTVQICNALEFVRKPGKLKKDLKYIQVNQQCYRIYQGIDPVLNQVADFTKKLTSLLNTSIVVDWAHIQKEHLTVRKATAFKDDFLVFAVRTPLEGKEQLCLVKKATTDDSLLGWNVSKLKKAYEREEVTVFNIKDFQHPPFERLEFPERPTYYDFLDTLFAQSERDLNWLLEDLKADNSTLSMGQRALCRNKTEILVDCKRVEAWQYELTMERKAQDAKRNYAFSKRPPKKFAEEYNKHLKDLQKELQDTYLLHKEKYYSNIREARTRYVGAKLKYTNAVIDEQVSSYYMDSREYWRN